jgi:hypothetical protein
MCRPGWNHALAEERRRGELAARLEEAETGLEEQPEPVPAVVACGPTG